MSFTKDGVAGALFLLIGLAGILIGRQYSVGTAVEMGAGYFPVLISSGVALCGAALFIKALVSGDGERVEWGTLRPLVVVVATIILFALLVERVGLVLTVFSLVFFCGLATVDTKWREVALIAPFLTAFVVGLFKYALSMPVPAWPF